MTTHLSVKQWKPLRDYLRGVLMLNGHRIHSLNLVYPRRKKSFRCVSFIDASFIRLEHLRLYQIKLINLIPLLIMLADVPRLTSLHVHLDDDVKDYAHIYPLIFALPSIRDLEVARCAFSILTPFPLPMAEQCVTRIESLSIGHACTMHALLAVLSYTPRLRRLNC